MAKINPANLRKWRDHAGITQKQMSIAIEKVIHRPITQASISRIESGDQGIKLDILRAYQKILAERGYDLTLDDLLTTSPTDEKKSERHGLVGFWERITT